MSTIFPKDPDTVDQDLIQVIKNYYIALIEGDPDLYRSIITDKTMKFGIGNANNLVPSKQTNILDKMDQLSKKFQELDVSFVISDYYHIFSDEQIAFFEIDWKMKWKGGGGGLHWTCFHLVKIAGGWKITGILDRGYELLDDNIETLRDHAIIDETFIQNLVDQYNSSIRENNPEQFKLLNHEQAISNRVGNSGELVSMSIDEVIKFNIKGLQHAKETIEGFSIEYINMRYKHIAIADVTATAIFDWTMKMHDSKGIHKTCMHFALDGDRWRIVNVLDHGLEIR